MVEHFGCMCESQGLITNVGMGCGNGVVRGSTGILAGMMCCCVQVEVTFVCALHEKKLGTKYFFVFL